MKYLSLFSGIGGFELGIQRAFNNEYAHISEEPEQEERTQGRVGSTDQQEVLLHAGDRSTPLCVGYSEIDKYAIKVYERQFNGHTNYGDATKINAEELPDFDLLVGGFPCQAFSVAGKRAGFDDTRGTLFFDIARILKEKQPRHLVLENVKGLLSHDKGRTFSTIIGVLTDLGYSVEWQVLNSKDFGVPQNRERIFIIGHLRGECGGQVFPIIGTDGKTTKIYGRVTGLKGHDYLRRVYSADGASPTLPTGTGGNHHAKVAVDLTRRAEGSHRVRKDGRVGTLDANYYKGLANQERPGVKEGVRVRKLTPTECERLQGFPDNWTKFGEDEHGMRVDISDTQRYKMCGNAVTVNVIEAIFKEFAKHEDS